MKPVREIVLRDGPLTLRPIRREEAALYASWWDDPEVQWGFCSEGRTEAEILAAFPELEMEARDIGHGIDWVVELEGCPIGYVWLSHWDLDRRAIEMNLLLDAGHRRQGWARRLIPILRDWVFQHLEIDRLSLCPREDHLPAHRCYRATGARQGEIQEETVTFRGETVCFREFYFERGGEK